jgi:BrnA antitoxin of type II toxin-antitoxin system
MSDWIDPDDAPILTAEIAARAEIRDGGKVIRAATGTLMGRPPLGSAAKQQVTLRLDREVIEAFRAGGPGGNRGSMRCCGRLWGCEGWGKHKLLGLAFSGPHYRHLMSSYLWSEADLENSHAVCGICGYRRCFDCVCIVY